ncbi:MAG: amino acid permease [Gammaproteobacteria bacterium]|nr:amino acid permease [Gammaproteobacteria bacterium]NNC96795.1 amino acid permease [Gammaproteobacteria bacterium]NNM13407.1 amino acid permease [Gammaproteobacteria bacterium]
MASTLTANSGKFNKQTAIAVIVANMIGTGVFTSLGFQLLDIQSGFVILMLWLVGGVTALCGALSYAELGAAFPRSGGEYNFLNEIYHPLAGFVSGWISATIGFAAPTALAAITFGKYFTSVYPQFSSSWLACGLIVVLTLVHASTRRNSGQLQSVFTILKILLIVVFCVLCWLLVDEPQPINFLPAEGDKALMFSGAFAVSLIYVNYAYSGWNAATYLSSELEDPKKNLPIILGIGTAIVILMYLALNFTFLYVAPVESMQGQIEVGYIAAQSVFGPSGAAIMGVSLSLLLISTVSAMIIAAPRVLQMIGEDFSAFRFLGKTNQHGIPANAIYTQSGISLLFILTGTFEEILIFAGFALGLNTFMAVLGVFILRWRQPDIERPYKTWAYPLTPIIFLSLTGWTLVYLLIDKPKESFTSLGIIFIGIIFYFVSRAFSTIKP